ncbi:glutamate synthase [NADPH] large chain [Photobacterium aphoticum]|uniref:Glutamate synthase [NADPH] large chain n=1 Tax=Photobacterium aphoticum TaxID=754436 RepID=A0A090QRY0_9GAMM|nr:glutamate synthase [NADPH] large chain [Photobacterium aphoticum]
MGRHPYKEWLDSHVKRLIPFEDLGDDQVGSRSLSDTELCTYQKLFAMNREELEQVLQVMGENGQEATGSMGDDAPMAVLSSKERAVTDYFRQMFAQVTNANRSFAGKTRDVTGHLYRPGNERVLRNRRPCLPRGLWLTGAAVFRLGAVTGAGRSVLPQQHRGYQLRPRRQRSHASHCGPV